MKESSGTSHNQVQSAWRLGRSNPLATSEQNRFRDLCVLPIVAIAMVKSGFSPGPGDPTSLPRRVIRILGGTVLLLGMAGICIAGWKRVLAGR